MAITRLNNNSLTSITALPSAVAVGKILQVVSNTVTTNNTTSGTSYTDTGLSATITPTSSSSKILVLPFNPLGGDIDDVVLGVSKK
tara:strand:- start:11 stop:268 length:258 start_codon:yes stop_codon:yes gene_type:complete